MDGINLHTLTSYKSAVNISDLLWLPMRCYNLMKDNITVDHHTVSCCRSSFARGATTKTCRLGPQPSRRMGGSGCLVSGAAATLGTSMGSSGRTAVLLFSKRWGTLAVKIGAAVGATEAAEEERCSPPMGGCPSVLRLSAVRRREAAIEGCSVGGSRRPRLDVL
jgi:hypothetical protein